MPAALSDTPCDPRKILSRLEPFILTERIENRPSAVIPRWSGSGDGISIAQVRQHLFGMIPGYIGTAQQVPENRSAEWGHGWRPKVTCREAAAETDRHRVRVSRSTLATAITVQPPSVRSMSAYLYSFLDSDNRALCPAQRRLELRPLDGARFEVAAALED